MNAADRDTRTATLTIPELETAINSLRWSYMRLAKKAARSDPRQRGLIDEMRICQVTLQKLAAVKNHPWIE